MSLTAKADDLTHDWPAEIFDALHEADIRQVTYVPDAGHATLIDLCLGDNRTQGTTLANEMEVVKTFDKRPS